MQHVGERFHPFNTARIVHESLRHCDLIVDHNRRLGLHHLPIQAKASLLFPRPGAPLLSELPVTERPSQLIIIDGTWHQAKTIVRDVPQLRDLPCYRLLPATPGQYRIRREPDAHSLSTLEATVAALRTLEPDTVGFDQLLSAFHGMVENQLAYPASRAAWRSRKPRQSVPGNIPRAILQDPDRLVVAYGEATPGQPGQRTVRPSPVNWVAQRLGTSEQFSCRLQQQRPPSPAALDHMRLSRGEFDVAVSQDTFCHQWNQFLRGRDVLIVYHQRTCQLLRNVEASQPRCLVLKSIFANLRVGFHSLEELAAITKVKLPPPDNQSRAMQRLKMAIALVEHLRTRFGKQP